MSATPRWRPSACAAPAGFTVAHPARGAGGSPGRLRKGLRRLAVMAGLASSGVSAATVPTESGLVQGLRADGVTIHLGVPYAAAPVGDLRWQPPAPPITWQGVRPAAAAAPHCLQQRGASLEGGGDPGVLSEDCLFLNIFAPTERNGPRPVMVWLHGGALVLGGGALPVYDGRALAQRGVIVVTVNYRLGALGFFAHPALEQALPGGPVNFGLLDQVAALRWVRQNIAAFGGDPAQVTIFGQSAGAQSVLALMASPLAQGLFQRAIAQSPYGIPSHTRARALAYGSDVARAAGLPGARATLAGLRALPAEQLVAPEDPSLTLAPSFVVGDAAVPRPLIDAFRQGRQVPVPLVIGSNSDEASVALAFGLDPAALVARLGAARILVRPLYPGVDDDAELGRQVVRDLAFSAYVRRIAVLHAARAPTWRYWFSHVPGGLGGPSKGVAHGGEVPYVMGTLQRCGCLVTAPQAADEAVAQRVGDRWAAFAGTGRPHLDDGDWPADSRRRPVVLDIGAADRVQPRFLQTRLNAFIGALNLVPPPGR